MSKKAVMYGAGSIGRGFIGQVFSDSGYETVFIDVNKELIDLLNERKQYPVRFVKNSGSREIMVENVCGIYGQDAEAVADAIAQADIMATSVGKNVLPVIAKVIAEGLKLRWKRGNFVPLNIIVCENMIKCNEYLRQLISSHLSEAEKEYLEEYIGTVETTIGRNVPVMTADLWDGDPLRVLAEDYTLLPLDEKSIKGELPYLKYTEMESDFGFYIRQKLFMYNMAHAVVGYLGSMRNIQRLCDAVVIPDIKYVALRALNESACAMAAEYNVDLRILIEFGDELLYRFNNKFLGIAVPRLALDPIRKLADDDRLVGPARLCQKHQVIPAFLAVGIAAGYCFANEEDKYAMELQTYITEYGIENAIEHFSGISKEEKLFGWILKYYDMFQSGKTLGKIIEEAEEISQMK